MWPGYERQAKSAASYLRDPGVKKLLMHHLSGPDVSTARAAVKSFTASFAEWRWGTLHEVCKQLGRLQPFRDVLVQVLRRRISTKAGMVMETFGSDRFWQLNTACAFLGSELEDFRQWCCGCP